MKREVWVECEPGHQDFALSGTFLKKITLHESRWIPVSERMPTKNGHYHVFRLDREDWCYGEMNEEFTCKPQFFFTSKGVTHWLEAPPLPVEMGVKEPTKLSWPVFDDPPEGYCKTDVVAWVHQAKIGKEKRLCRMFHRTEPRGESHILESFCWVPFEEVIAIS